MAADDGISLREHFDLEFATVRRDLATLAITIRETAEAHAKSHDRDHHLTEVASSKSEAQAQKIDDERKRQIEEIKAEVVRQANEWSSLNGKVAAIGALLTALGLLSAFLAIWARFG